MNKAYVAENDAERQRLFQITAGLSEEDLARPLSEQWSVGATLAHLAFWDRYYLSLLQRWERNGFTPTPADADAINDAALVLISAIPPKAIVPLVQAAVEAVDHKVEMLAPELAEAIENGGSPRILYRARHRREHLDEIERALGRTR